MKLLFPRIGILLLSLILSLSLGCFPSKKMTVMSAGSLLGDVAKASARQSNLKLIREGTPSYLMLMDGMIEAWPDNDRLLIAAAQAYASYASLILEDQDRKDQEKEAREYDAMGLYGKARKYALKSLEMRGLKKPLETPLDDFKDGLKGLGKKDLPTIFWTATCWASWISLKLDSMEALAELPKVEALMKRSLELDESFYYGGAHLFMGIWSASRPKGFGQDLKKAQDHFLKAIEYGEGKFLMTYIYYATYYARQALDKDLFISTLQKVLETPADILPDLTLLNTVAQKKAQELLNRVEEYFE
jgi:hypothetical protein